MLILKKTMPKVPNHKVLFKYMPYRIIVTVILLFSFSSCENNTCLMSSGEKQLENREIGGFKKLIIEDVFTVYYKYDTISRIEVYAGFNLLTGIKTTIIDSSLTIENTNKCNWTRSLKVRPEITIFSPTLDCVIMNGESDFITTDTLKSNDLTYEVWAGISTANLLLDCEVLKFKLNGVTGDYTLNGSAGVAYIFSIGNGHIHGTELNTGYSFINNSSTGDIKVNVSKEIEVHLLNTGNIYYFGNPYSIVVLEQQSTGSLIYGN